MLALIAAVLFFIAALFKLIPYALGPFDWQLLGVIGLFCMALYMAGIGPRRRW